MPAKNGARKIQIRLAIVATIIAIILGLGQMGLVWPWSALDENIASSIYETKEHAEAEHKALRSQQDRLLVDILQQLRQINSRLEKLNKED